MNTPNQTGALSIAAHTKFANTAVRIVIEKGGKYLVVQEGKANVYGLWAFPGGKVDVGESLTEAAKREVLEDTGIEVELTGLIGADWVVWDSMPGYTNHFFFLGVAVKIPENFTLLDEILAIEWKTLDELQEIAKTDQFRIGQSPIVEMVQRGVVLPLDSLSERVGKPAPEALR